MECSIAFGPSATGYCNSWQFCKVINNFHYVLKWILKNIIKIQEMQI
jgi:hypothetical protein